LNLLFVYLSTVTCYNSSWIGGALAVVLLYTNAVSKERRRTRSTYLSQEDCYRNILENESIMSRNWSSLEFPIVV